tara:strand:- start:63 stop:545 length:483 start_codon:yes stop_codon:yes gene_type:complete
MENKNQTVYLSNRIQDRATLLDDCAYPRELKISGAKLTSKGVTLSVEDKTGKNYIYNLENLDLVSTFLEDMGVYDMGTGSFKGYNSLINKNIEVFFNPIDKKLTGVSPIFELKRVPQTVNQRYANHNEKPADYFGSEFTNIINAFKGHLDNHIEDILDNN